MSEINYFVNICTSIWISWTFGSKYGVESGMMAVFFFFIMSNILFYISKKEEETSEINSKFESLLERKQNNG